LFEDACELSNIRTHKHNGYGENSENREENRMWICDYLFAVLRFVLYWHQGNRDKVLGELPDLWLGVILVSGDNCCFDCDKYGSLEEEVIQEHKQVEEHYRKRNAIINIDINTKGFIEFAKQFYNI